MTALSIDFETRATVDLKKSGVYPYAAHPETDIWCMAWALGDEEPEIWTPDDGELPANVLEHLIDGGEVRAWNAAFERIVWREIMVKRYGAPPVALEQWVCTAAEAAAMSLPRSLGEAAKVLGVAEQKDAGGSDVMWRMARPRRIEPDGRVVWWDAADRKAKLFAYCVQDVKTERACAQALRRLTPKEREIYLLDQRINDRGVRVDTALVRAAQQIVDTGIARANATLSELTGGNVSAVTNHGRLREWLEAQGVDAASVSKAAVRDMLETDLTPAVRAVLETRADAGRSSIAKLDSMLACAGADDRARGLLLYHAASTGRWAGRLVQPQNFPRGEVEDAEAFIGDVLRGAYDRIDLVAPPIVVVLSLLRAMLTAAPGMDLIAADYAAIEARVLNWLAGQEDIVRLFASGADVYKHNAAKLFKLTIDQITKALRQYGKFQELACGFGMGAKKAVSAAKTIYGIAIDDAQAKEIVDGYRSTHDRVVAFWYETERAVIEATENPGRVVTFGGRRNLRAVKSGAYLYLILPSGRPLCYASPKVVEAEVPWGGTKPQLEISGVDPYSKQWGRLRLYGGLLVENIVQAVSRDLMAEAMLRAESAGYPPILSVHDEVIVEVPKGQGSVAEFEAILTALPTWAEGCPVAAEGWRGERYRK